ncbi:unnamed protein product [Paramecium octaurelia]|uniref:Uncharacterized protein n=1 Tax=Paramecium octaurelia TaxID=43137 RepID=A0A8S1RZW1_PAROT|nr:unnamed protein product [Paramecium octaurelia]
MDNEPKIIKKIYVYPATSIQQMKQAQEYQQINRQLYQDQHIQKLMDMCLSNQMSSILNRLDFEDLQQPLKEVQYFLKDLKGKFIQQPKNKIKEPLISKIPNKKTNHLQKTQLLASIKQKLMQMVQESKLFPSLINFIKIEYDQQNYQFNVCKLGLLNDAAEIMLQCGPFGILNAQIKGPTNLTITDLILELFRQLNHYNVVEDKEIAEEVWFSFNRAKNKTHLSEILSHEIAQNLSYKDMEIQREILILQGTIQKLNYNAQFINNQREKIIKVLRKRVQVQLYHECQVRKIAQPEILPNLTLSIKQYRSTHGVFCGCALQFPIVMIKKFSITPGLEDVCKNLCLSILQNLDTINFCLAITYEKYLSSRLYKEHNTFQVRTIIQNALEDIIQKMETDVNLCKFLRLAILDQQFIKFYNLLHRYNTINQNDTSIPNDKRDQTNQLILNAVHSILEKVKNLQLENNIIEQKYEIALPPEKIIKVNMKKHKTNQSDKLLFYIKLIANDLNKLKIPLFEIIYYITAMNNRIQFRIDLQPKSTIRFFTYPHIIYYIEELYGVKTIVEWESDMSCEIDYFSLANLDLSIDLDEEYIIEQQLIIMERCLKRDRARYSWALEYLGLKCHELLLETKQLQKCKIRKCLENLYLEVKRQK